MLTLLLAYNEDLFRNICKKRIPADCIICFIMKYRVIVSQLTEIYHVEEKDEEKKSNFTFAKLVFFNVKIIIIRI